LRVLIWMILATQLFGYTLTTAQTKVKEKILSIAPQYTKYKSTILAIAMVESSLGVGVLGDDAKSLGITQLQIPTVRFLITKDKSLRFLNQYSNKQLESFLLRHDDLSIIITCKLFEYYRKRYGYFQAISRYNGGKHNYHYYNKVVKWRNRFIKD